MTFYRPRVAQVTSWSIAASPGESLFRTVTIPPVSTTQATIFTAFTGATVPTSSIQSAGGGSYFSSTGTSLSFAMGMDTFAMLPGDFHWFAQCGMIGDAEDVATGTPLAPYLAAGLRYDFNLGITSIPNPIDVYISGVLTILVLDGPATTTPVPTEAATGTAGHYNFTAGLGTSTGSVDIWLDALYSNVVHVVSCWGAQAFGLPSGNWWLAGDAFQPAVHGLPSVSQSVAVAANAPSSISAVASPITYALDSSAQWAIMAFQSDLVPSPYVPPVAIPSNLATIVG